MRRLAKALSFAYLFINQHQYTRRSQHSNVIGQNDKPFTLPPPKDITPNDVLQVVKHTDYILQHIIQHLNISLRVNTLPQKTSITPTNVYNLLLQTNQKVSAPLDTKATPSEIQQVTMLSVHYAGEILNIMRGATTPTTANKYTANKKASDIYAQQLTLLNLPKVINESLS